MKKSTCFGLLALTFASGLITAKVLSKYDRTSDSSDPLGIIEEDDDFDDDDYDEPFEDNHDDPDEADDLSMIYGTDLSDLYLPEEDVSSDEIPVKKSSAKSKK